MGYLSPSKSNPPQIGNSPFLKIFTTSSPQTFYSSPLWLEMATSAFFTHGYFQQAHIHISEAIITD